MKRYLYLIFVFLAVSVAFAQNRTIEGRITAQEDGQGLPGVNVIVQGTSKGTATDFEGHYKLELSPEEKTVVITFIGYKTQTITVGDRTTIDVVMEPDTKTLEEVVVVAYGTQKKSDLTGAVASLRGADLVKIPSLDPTMALQGKVAGVQVTNSTGAPGSQPVIRIRGTGTFNDSSPIYVVDGVILQDISFLNSNDIQSMEILKDASATALYGSRGANGVVLITTKLGKKGQTAPVISFSGDYSIQNQQKRIDLLDGPQFATVVNEITPGSFNNVNAVANTDWQSQIFRKPSAAPIQNYQFSTSGSSEKIQYYIGVGYFKQDGIIPKSSYERLTIRLNNTYHLSKSIRFGNNMTLAPYQQQLTNEGVVFTAYRAQPVVPPYDANGKYSPVPNVGNPLADLNYVNSYARGLRIVGNVFGEVEFLKGFTARSSFGVDVTNKRAYDFTPVFFVNAQQQNSLSILNKSWGNQGTWLWENTLAYNKEAGKHKINALGGLTMQETSSENVKLQAKNLLRESKDFWYITPTTLRDYVSANGADLNSVDPNQNYSIMSFLGRVNYTFDSRFLFTATFRRDGSSKFAKQNRFGNFPSFGAGWNVINENFMKGVTFLSNLKVRGSWGIVGNEKIDYLRQYSKTIAFNPVFGTAVVPGLTYDASGNPNLKWETTHQTDIGLEVGFFEGRLNVEADYYRKDTKDILVPLDVAAYQGNGLGKQITYNAAEVINQGLELTIGWKGKISNDWSYTINGNATTINNKVVSVNGIGGASDYLYGTYGGNTLTRTAPGQPIGEFYGYKVIGVFQNAGDLAATPHRGDAGVGDLKFADVSGPAGVPDGKIDDNDRVSLGSPIPTLLYGLNLGSTYKNFELSIDIMGVSGNKIYNYKETVRPDLYNFEKHVINRWTGDGTSNSEPRATSGGYNWLPSSRFIQSGSFIRLRSVSLSYNVPKGALDKVRMKSARVFVRGTNLFTHSKYTGYTPEISSPKDAPPTYSAGNAITSGVDTGTYPLPAIYSAGINVTF